MQVKVTNTFNDVTIEDQDNRRREIGDVFDASDDRAEHLEMLGLVEKIAPLAPAEIGEPLAIPATSEPAPLAPAVANELAQAAPATTADDHVAHD